MQEYVHPCRYSYTCGLKSVAPIWCSGRHFLVNFQNWSPISSSSCNTVSHSSFLHGCVMTQALNSGCHGWATSHNFYTYHKFTHNSILWLSFPKVRSLSGALYLPSSDSRIHLYLYDCSEFICISSQNQPPPCPSHSSAPHSRKILYQQRRTYTSYNH